MESMMKNKNLLLSLVICAALITACDRQSTPSMMNTSLPRVEAQTTMDQILVENVSEGYLKKIANNYDRYATDTLMMTISYDPLSKDYDAMKAFQDLARFKQILSKMGINSVRAEAVKSEGVKPTLMIAYDSVSAKTPEGCRNMPGFDDGLTTPEIGDYRFGCSIDSMIAKQIYRPSDLQGKVGNDAIDGRRAANTVEYYRRVSEEEAEGELRTLDRSDIQGQ